MSMDDLDRRVRLERLFGEHSAAVRAYARRRVVAATADDVVSEVFVVAWRRRTRSPTTRCRRRSVRSF